jgi:carboxypeptidase family protein/TonB-dependent receptor-like protein
MVRQVLGFGTVGMSAALLAAVPADVCAQRNALSGTVLDTAGAPIIRADVSVAAVRQLVQTDDRGRFYVPRLPDGDVEVMVRRLGYEPQRLFFVFVPDSAQSVTIIMQPNAKLLNAIEVSTTELRRRLWIEDFYRRRAHGIGTYIVREDIEKRQSLVPTDILRNTPGIRFVRVRGSNRGVRFNASSTGRRDCMPMIWVDGQKAPGLEIDDVTLNDIEGIELYNGPSTTPMQFSQGQSSFTCGTIVIWSRVPGS